MTATDTGLDFYLATLFLDYLSHADSITAGVPDADTLPKQIMDAGLKPTFPSLVITASEQGSMGPRRTVLITVMILTWLKANDEGAADVEEQTTSLQASAWIAKISARLRDREAFKEWHASLPTERTENLALLKCVHKGTASPVRNAQTRTVFYPYSFEVLCIAPHA